MDFLINLFLLKLVNVTCPERKTSGQSNIGWFALGIAADMPTYAQDHVSSWERESCENPIRPISIMEREDKDTFDSDPFLNGDYDSDPNW